MTEEVMMQPSRRIGSLLLALVVGMVLFIPFERLLDSWFPGNHIGFGLMGIWFWLVLPASIVLGIALLVAQRRAYDRGTEQARRIADIGWLLTGLLYLAATWLYRRSG